MYKTRQNKAFVWFLDIGTFIVHFKLQKTGVKYQHKE